MKNLLLCCVSFLAVVIHCSAYLRNTNYYVDLNSPDEVNQNLEEEEEDKNSDLSEALIQYIESLRGKFTKPITKFGIPTLDPFLLNFYEINAMEGDIVGFVKDVKVFGLSQYRILNLNLNKLNISIMVPRIKVIGFYKVEGEAQGIHLFGDGSLDVEIIQPMVSIEAVMKFEDSHLLLKNLTLDVDIKGLILDIDNLMGGGKIGKTLNQMVGAIAPDAIREMKGDILPKMAEKIIERVNSMLKDMPLLENMKENVRSHPSAVKQAIVSSLIMNAEPLLKHFMASNWNYS